MKNTKYMIITGLIFAASFSISVYCLHALFTLSIVPNWDVQKFAAFSGFCIGAIFYFGSHGHDE